MSNNISIKKKILCIKEKILTRLAHKHYRLIRAEIKVWGIDQGISTYRKDLYRLNIREVLIINFIALLAIFSLVIQITGAYQLLAYIKPDYLFIILWIVIYKFCKQEIYCFAYYQMLKEAIEEYKTQKDNN
ncbi:MAG: hypothetical protein WAQ98_29800 [Blastocatellia bacterium]